jgi:outer membrane protein OmpA-like peptidoglycan-associated protein
MKRLFILMSLALSFSLANAQQSIMNPKLTDNVYIGVNGGANTNLAMNKFFPVNPTFGIRIGKDVTPIFGVFVEGTAWFGSHSDKKRFGLRDMESFDRFDYLPLAGEDQNAYFLHTTGHNAVRGLNVGLNSTVNLTNLFCGYLGEPRPFEVSSVIGMGWGHVFIPSNEYAILEEKDEDRDLLTAKTGLDFNFNFGSEKQHQFYIEPAVIWALNKTGFEGVQFNKHWAYLSLSVGYNYKFGCSYGGHNFKFGRDCDAELRRLQALLDECNSRPPRVEIKEVEKIVYRDRPGQTITIDNLKVVPFEVNKWDLTEDVKADLNTIKEGSHVQVIGTASPEGNAEWNQELSNNRANTVAEYLENRGVIVDSKEGRGVEGKTSNRLAIVYIIK